MCHPQVVLSSIFNDYLKLNVHGHTKQQLVAILLLRVSVRELRNRLLSDPVYGGLKESRDAENNISISDSTLRSLLPPQLKNVIKIQGYVWL